jgi:hypothetical protein
MNTKVVYAAGIVILIVGIIFYFVNSGMIIPEYSSLSPSSPSTSTTSSPTLPISVSNATETTSVASIMPVSSSSSASNAVGSNYENLTVSAKSVDVLTINDVPTIQIALDVHNPNRGAAILETLSYGVYLDNVRLASADIGTKPEGFVDSLESVYTIIGNQTITLRDRQPLTEEGVSLFNSNGTATQSTENDTKTQTAAPGSFVINGTFATTLNRGSQSQASEQPFSLQYPLKQLQIQQP